MIYLNTYTYEKKLSKYKNNYEDLFKNTVMNKELDTREIELVKLIDNAKYIGNNTIKDQFGNVISIELVSRGLKVLLVTRWFIKNKKENINMNISSCGDNVFDPLIEEIGNTDIHLLTCNYTVCNSKKADILVNDRYKITCFSDLASLGGKLYASNN